MFYDVYCDLCARNGMTPSGVATRIGFSRATVTMWKTNGGTPRQELLVKIADFFGVSTDYLLEQEHEKAPTDSGEREMSDAELKFALWGDCQDMSDEDLADVRRYAAFVRERKREQQ